MLNSENLLVCQHRSWWIPKTSSSASRRHGKLQNPSSCLQRWNSEISAAGMVSALKYHHAYGNVHNPGWTVGTMTLIFGQRAYKIDRNCRHDHLFTASTCLRSSFYFRMPGVWGAPHELGRVQCIQEATDFMWVGEWGAASNSLKSTRGWLNGYDPCAAVSHPAASPSGNRVW